ncbi:ADC synthase [Amanita rubescens]|nr:ADC synthase [Amanita rubescens]
MTIESPRILLVDSYDSFSLKLSIPGCIVHVIKNDEYAIDELEAYLAYFSAVVTKTIPIFGVCLGLQSLGTVYGAKLRRLHTVKHGQVSVVRHTGQDIFRGIGTIQAVRYHSLYIEPTSSDEIEELAWADDDENGQVLMACKHKSRPFWAVQYHPESVLTNNAGAQVMQNFWKLSQRWSTIHARRPRPWDARLRRLGDVWPLSSQIRTQRPISEPKRRVRTLTVSAPHLTPISICELLGVNEENEPFITYSLNENTVTLQEGQSKVKTEALGMHDIWSWLANFMHAHNALGGDPHVPFWGGLIGYLTYELGVSSLQIPVHRNMEAKQRHPDVNLVFVERSIVLDSCNGLVYVQSLLEDDDTWLSEMLPDRERYLSRIYRAKEWLYSGDSYELCLTAQTHFLHGNDTSYSESSIPAPHSAYLRLHPSTLISSSPERFLSFTRAPNTVCQLRPIKGTVKKAPGITRADAEQALVGSEKEVAENLMIVDLIRHDLHSVVGDQVQVKQFCCVEEYETVWQLVSVIEGKDSSSPEYEGLGLDVLRRSLPPGSMTGAPKKRSVEILKSLENVERSLYSGVFGYWCVSGAGDWKEWVIGAGGAITALSDPEAEWDEMITKLQSVLRAFGPN